MKKIISLSLAALLLVALLLTTTSCGMGMEGMTGYTRLRDHLVSQNVYDDKVVTLDTNEDTYIASLCAVKDENNAFILQIIAQKISVQVTGETETTPTEEARLIMTLNGSSEKATIQYEAQNSTVKAESTLYFIHYTGEDPITFDTVNGLTTLKEEQQHRTNARDLCNVMLKALDSYLVSELDMSVSELGFIVLSETYMAPKDAVQQDEDLGGAFSSARLTKAGLMLLQGMGMVFLVLAILWLVLIIFKKLLYKGDSKTEKPKKTAPPVEVAPTHPASPVAPTDDAQLIAVITAAVAAAIESDEDLSAEFIGGFRVVSFQKKSGKTSWNH